MLVLALSAPADVLVADAVGAVVEVGALQLVWLEGDEDVGRVVRVAIAAAAVDDLADDGSVAPVAAGLTDNAVGGLVVVFGVDDFGACLRHHQGPRVIPGLEVALPVGRVELLPIPIDNHELVAARAVPVGALEVALVGLAEVDEERVDAGRRIEAIVLDCLHIAAPDVPGSAAVDVRARHITIIAREDAEVAALLAAGAAEGGEAAGVGAVVDNERLAVAADGLADLALVVVPDSALLAGECLPVTEPLLEARRADVQPLSLCQSRGRAVGRLEPLVGAFVLLAHRGHFVGLGVDPLLAEAQVGADAGHLEVGGVAALGREAQHAGAQRGARDGGHVDELDLLRARGGLDGLGHVGRDRAAELGLHHLRRHGLGLLADHHSQALAGLVVLDEVAVVAGVEDAALGAVDVAAVPELLGVGLGVVELRQLDFVGHAADAGLGAHAVALVDVEVDAGLQARVVARAQALGLQALQAGAVVGAVDGGALLLAEVDAALGGLDCFVESVGGSDSVLHGVEVADEVIILGKLRVARSVDAAV